MREVIPCKDCLIFPMCKSRYIHKPIFTRCLNYTAMKRKCSLFREWFNKADENELKDAEKLFEFKCWG